MISTADVSLAYGERVLFKEVSLKFLPGNCYGLIGANGAGKSTFLKILAGEIPPDHGVVTVPANHRVAVLRQNQFEFDEVEVLKTVLMGSKELHAILQERERLYAKADFSEEDGMLASDLEIKFAELDGWNAESQVGEMLEAIDVPSKFHNVKMKELEAGLKVRVLLAQALFGNPDILLLDEPTNNLDLAAIAWLEEFLCEFKNTVVVVSHDRHFLDKVCTHIADIDFGEINLYTGNYTFWYESSQLALKQQSDRNRKAEEKIKDLKEFVARFSANASKSRQATSRKKLLDKLSIDQIKPSSRKYPHIAFQQQREAGKDLLSIRSLSGEMNGHRAFGNLDLTIGKGEKVAFVGRDNQSAAVLFKILAGEHAPVKGEFSWGVTAHRAYFPKEHGNYFKTDGNLIEWLRQFAQNDQEREEEYLRSFLGKMLFSGPEVFKKTDVLSGGEKVRCMMARIMMQQPNVVILDEPTNHLDLESITALNNGLIRYNGTILLISQDREIIDTIATRIVELTPKGVIDKTMGYEEYLERADLVAERERLYV